MARGLDGVVRGAVGEDGVVRALLPVLRAGEGAGAGDGDAVARAGAALGQEEVPPAIATVEVRALGVAHAGALPEVAGSAQVLPGERVDREAADPAAVRAPGAPGEVAGAVLVPDQVGVDAGRARDVDRAGQGAGGIGGVDDELALGDLADIGGDQVEQSVVVAQRGGEDARRRRVALERELVRAVEDVAHGLPGEQVRGAVQGDARGVLKARARQPVGVADAADGGVGVVTGENRSGGHRWPSSVTHR